MVERCCKAVISNGEAICMWIKTKRENTQIRPLCLCFLDPYQIMANMMLIDILLRIGALVHQ
jgi:hypothetical protein